MMVNVSAADFSSDKYYPMSISITYMRTFTFELLKLLTICCGFPFHRNEGPRQELGRVLRSLIMFEGATGL